MSARAGGIGVVLLAMCLVGCFPTPQENTETPEPKESTMSEPIYNWESAKADTQAMELEIAALVPTETIVGVEQMPHGTLLSCSELEWSWNGATTVTVADGTEIESLVRAIQAHYETSRFDTRTDINIVGKLELQLMADETAENYIIVEGIEPNQLRISSGSPCFVLPEGTWPGGVF